MSFTRVVPQWGPIIDRDADFKPYTQYPVNKTDQDPILDMIITGASDWVQTYLDRPIAPTRFEERFDGWAGWGGATIMLPYQPVLEIVEVNEYWGLNGPKALTEQTPANQWGVGYSAANPSPGTYQINRRTGALTRTFPGLIQKPFFPGSRNIEIVWIAGYDPIPAQLKLATLEFAQHWYRNTQEQTQITGNFGAAAQGNDGVGGSPLWPGVPGRVTAMLEPFLQQGIG